MCGIIGIISRPSHRAVPTSDDVVGLLDRAVSAIPAITDVAVHVIDADRLLRGDAGIQCLAGNLELIAAITSRLERLDDFANAEEQRIDSLHADSATLDEQVEQLSRLRDGLWALRRDRIRTAHEVHALAGRSASAGALCGYLSIQQALSAIDRMEVRGRDSAGISVLVWADGVATNPDIAQGMRARTHDPLFTNNSVRLNGNCLVFVYKAAAEIGELGDNTRVMRAAVKDDQLLRLALALPGVRTTVLGHTRWASVGIISEPNAHPVTGEEIDHSTSHMSVAALNGDVDNHADLKMRYKLSFADPITTDAKVIPALVDRFRESSPQVVDAFRNAVTQFEGSVAISYATADHPDSMYLALHGSGQGMCIGLAEDRYVVASEPYGVVEETQHYIRMDGEVLADPSRPSSRGQIVVLDAAHAGHLDGVDLLSYEGDTMALTSADVHTAEVTTRDIDRGNAPHFLLKEISEAPSSFRKTLRGRIAEDNGQLVPELDQFTLPNSVIDKIRNGQIARVRIIGQGTAAIAGRAMVTVLDALTDGQLQIDAMTATELSGFAMYADMSDMLVVAVSQSGTTTDTNRTVDLVAGRGASVLAIVNRRGSELANKAHGVYYTSDGRDIEMSVASTKAFYAQVAAGVVLSCAITKAMGHSVNNKVVDEKIHRILESLREMPHAMDLVLQKRTEIAAIAQQFAPSRRYWAVVGNGPNAVAANEVRIKLSELCYKSISCDVTEDKKHIDLSCEPMIMVCAAGLGDGTATDVAKEVAIYRAHKATPIVVATEGESRFDAASAVVAVPRVEPNLAFILSAMVGHLFGYEAALAIDALARPLRQAREAIEHVVERGGDGDDALVRVAREIVVPAQHFLTSLHTGEYNGNLEASTAVKLVSVLGVVTGPNPLGDYQRLTGRVSTPASLLDDLLASLTKAIDELTRPIDAIKHQAKTVTVGISRSEEGLLDRELVKAVIEAGVARDRLSYASLKVLADLDVAVAQVTGYTRYRIEGEPATGNASIFIVERSGLSRDLPSRVDSSNVLVGTKRRVANEQQVLVARGRSDNRTVILVPEIKGSTTTGLTLLHVTFHDRLPVASMRRVLQGYDHRYDRLVDWVTETEGSFREDRLAEVSVADMLINPVSESANAWRGK